MNTIKFLLLIVVSFISCDANDPFYPNENVEDITNGRLDKIMAHLTDPNSNQVLVTAHRGDWFWAPENSLASFQNCIDIGVDMLEIDVRLTKDKVPVVIHDKTLDRSTTEKGLISERTFSSLQTVYLKDATGVPTKQKISSLEEVMLACKGKILVYLDKSEAHLQYVLPVLERTGTLGQTVFVHDFTYAEAQVAFGAYLDQVLYMPVVKDNIENLGNYVDEFLRNYQPKAFQMRLEQENSKSFSMISKIKKANSKLFIAATWPHHTAGHDDQLSRTNPEAGWGWLINNSISIIETNRPYQLLDFLRGKGLHE